MKTNLDFLFFFLKKCNIIQELLISNYYIHVSNQFKKNNLGKEK